MKKRAEQLQNFKNLVQCFHFSKKSTISLNLLKYLILFVGLMGSPRPLLAKGRFKLVNTQSLNSCK